MTHHAPLIIDVAGLTLTDDDRRRLAHPLVGGMILFGRNWQSRAQLSDLCADIKAVRPDLLICVDHEGGRVQRFRNDGFTHVPAMRTLGELWMRDPLGATNAATACGYVLASELRACGVDLSFAPVLDLDYSEEAAQQSRSTVIGDRAFARDARVVTLLAKSLVHGLQMAGMGHCGKHFPGHGYVRADSHTDIPVDKRPLKTILKDDAAPYGWLSAGLQAVMPAHVIYPKVDEYPTGFSPRWLQDILRDQLKFQGAIFSDDLSMKGARQLAGQELSFGQAAITALQAGCDLAMLCNQSLNGGEALDVLINDVAKAQLQGQWQPNEASEWRRCALLPKQSAIGWDELMVHPVYMHALDLLP